MKNQTRDISSFSASHSSGPRNHLLVLAINQYTEHPVLSNAVGDAQAIVNMLTRRFDFEADEGMKALYNERGTREEFYKALLEYQRTLTREDTLLIWFSGHGAYKPDTESGYWVPVNASKGESAALDWIDFDWLLKQLTGIRAGHIALIADSCHSGAALLGVAAGGVRKKENLPAPWILTSGRCDESVTDGLAGGHSPFALCLLDYLVQYNEPALLFSKLEEVVLQEKFSRMQQPCCRQIAGAGDGSGQYVFRLREEMQRKTASALSRAITPQGIADRLRENSARYHQRLRNGRFKLLHISDLILTESSARFFDSAVRLDRVEEVQSARLPEMLHRLWQPQIRNVLLMGDGGMGKTVASVRLWEQWAADTGAPIPLFISLNEYNAVAPDEECTFLRDSLFRHYLDTRQPYPDEECAFWNLFETPGRDGAPAALLILDGLNEVTREKGWLEKEIRNFMERCQGVQVLITTRYDMRNFTFLQHFEKADLQPLWREQIEDYLKKEGKTPPPANADDGLWSLLGNPMMLTLYASTGEWAQKCRGDDRFQFKGKAETTGELLWNFIEAQFAKLLELTPEIDPDTYAERCDFFLRFLVPWIGFQMELQGRFILPEGAAQSPEFNLEKLLREGFAYFDNPDFFHTFPRFRVRNKEKALLMLREPGWEAELDRFDLVKTWLCEYLRLFVQEEGVLRFAHQNFRDFFAACHLRNTAEMALGRGELPVEWKERPLPVYLRRMIGEIEGEQYFDAQKILRREPLLVALEENCLASLLEQCREHFEEKERDLGFAVWNVLSTWHDLRRTLAGADLSRLDLRKFVFNGKQLVAHEGKLYISARFNKSLLHSNLFVFKGHTGHVRSVCYSPDGKKALSFSNDGSVKEWSLETGACLHSFEGHSIGVVSAIYSSDGKKVLSASGDNTIKEWSTETGDCLQTFEHDSDNSKTSAIYSPNGEKVLSASYNAIKEWSAKTGVCLRIFIDGLYQGSSSAVYSPDGRKVLSISYKTIREWSVETGANLQNFDGHSDWVSSAIYSLDGKKILSASRDTTIKEWSVETGMILQTLEGHSGWVNSAVYSPDGKKILSTSRDNTMKEWSVKTKTCIQSFEGAHDGVSSGVYSSDGKKILSAWNYHDILEWSVETGVCLQSFTGDSSTINTAIYNSKGKKILSASHDKTVKEWSVKTGVCLQSFIGHSWMVNTAIYNPGGKKVLSTSWDSTIKEWSVETGECLHCFKGHSNIVTGAVYNPDGKKVLSTSWDDTVKEWSAETGECLQTLAGQVPGFLSSFKEKTAFTSWRECVNNWVAQNIEPSSLLDEENTTQTIDTSARQNQISEGIGRFLTTQGDKIIEKTATGEVQRVLINEIGLMVQSVDFRNLHPDSIFTEEEKSRLRRYGAIFDDEDERRWKEAVADAYDDIEDNPENPPQP